MASCKLGHIYIINTAIANPQKEKFAICVGVVEKFFVWINTLPRPHGKDQLPITSGCHELVTHDSFIDLSRVVIHDGWEFDDAKEFSQIDKTLCTAILNALSAGLEVMPPRHSDIIYKSLSALV